MQKNINIEDINMLKDLINDYGEFNDKINLKNKLKSNKKTSSDHYIAILMIINIFCILNY
jgi:hypothetical protein